MAGERLLRGRHLGTRSCRPREVFPPPVRSQPGRKRPGAAAAAPGPGPASSGPPAAACRPRRPGSDAPPPDPQARLPAHRQHVFELFERRLPAVPELEAEHDDVVAGLQLGRPKHHSGLDAWGARWVPRHGRGSGGGEEGAGKKVLSLMGKAQSLTGEFLPQEPPAYQRDAALAITVTEHCIGQKGRLGASPVAQRVKKKSPPAMQETMVRFLGWEDPLEKG